MAIDGSCARAVHDHEDDVTAAVRIRSSAKQTRKRSPRSFIEPAAKIRALQILLPARRPAVQPNGIQAKVLELRD